MNQSEARLHSGRSVHFRPSLSPRPSFRFFEGLVPRLPCTSIMSIEVTDTCEFHWISWHAHAVRISCTASAHSRLYLTKLLPTENSFLRCVSHFHPHFFVSVSRVSHFLVPTFSSARIERFHHVIKNYVSLHNSVILPRMTAVLVYK